MATQILFQGAESKIYVQEYLGRTMLVKERFLKKYRNPALDISLTKERMKAECRNIVRCKKAGLRTPAIYHIDMQRRLIYMEYIENGQTAKDLISQLQKDNLETSRKKLETLMDNIGSYLGKMHLKDIVHGDLTSSNILISNDQVIFIDFGLSSSNTTSLDKGVDLYVLERALLSTHADAEVLFDLILKSYSRICGKKSKEPLLKLEDVRARGRKRTMVG